MTWSEQAGRAYVYARSQGRCEVCGIHGAHTFHHRLKKGQGGTWAPSNGLHVCGDGTRFCHGWIEANPAHAMLLGLWVPAHMNPATVPAYLHPTMWWRSWWLADDDGCWTYAGPPPADRTDHADRLTAMTALHDGRAIPRPG